MELYLSSKYLKMCWERKNTPITWNVEKEKMVKTSKEHNFLLGTQNWENE
jgi:hypothetical protein